MLTEGLRTQVIESGYDIVVQGQGSSGFIRKVLGLEQAVTVKITVDKDDLQITIGGGRWLDKVTGAAVGWFLFAPAAVTAAYGIYNQQKIYGKIEKEIERFLESKGGKA